MSRSLWKLVASLVVLVVAVVSVMGVQASRLFREQAIDQRRLELEAAAFDARGRLTIPFDAGAERIYAAIEPVAQELGARVTLIRRDGVVVADSALPASRLPRLENHADRPEVIAAWERGHGVAQRTSATLGRSLLYAAVPSQGGEGVVRLAVELDERMQLAPLRTWLAQALAVGVLGALVLGVFLSNATARSIEHMSRVATRVAEGDLSQRVRRHTGDELDPIAGAIDRMAEQLRFRLEEATQEKERLQAVLNGMVEGVLVVDNAGKIVLVNDRARDFFEIRGDVAGRPLIEVLRNAELDALLAEAAETDDALSHGVQLGPRGERLLNVQANRFPPGSEARMGTVAVFHDVTEIERLEQIRRDFVANASHELRTPLTAISGFAETLLNNRSLGEDDRRSYLEVIDRHAERLTHLVSDLLELSKIESRKTELEVASVDVVALAERLLEDLHESVRDKRLVASVEHRGRPIARADVGALEQILMNLIDNAVKYSDDGGEVVVRIDADEDRVFVEVVDDGIGIPVADQERIFERFYRVDKARSRELGGTGLGLAIVKHLVQGQGGEITVESRLGRGSAFRFHLPRDVAEA